MPYLDELIDYGGEPYTRAEAIADMQQSGIDQPCIDRWLQGYEHAQRLRRTASTHHPQALSDTSRLTHQNHKPEGHGFRAC